MMTAIPKFLVALSLVFGVGCSDDNNSQPKDAGPQEPDASCFDITNIQDPSHEQIINACTPPTVQKIYKVSKPPLMNGDGTLPSLP